ncbi:MAG: hypothetical protein ACK5IJ_04375 [Mangrovibacterium sp.]
MNNKKIASWLLASCIAFSLAAQNVNQRPVVKIDFSQDQRKETEVGEHGYLFWNNFASTHSVSIGKLILSLSNHDGSAKSLKSAWYKAGINAAKLVNDGVTVDGGNEGAAIRLTINGLPEGEHSLLAFLNNIDSPQAGSFAPIDVLLNGKLVQNDIVPSVRAMQNADAQTTYITFNAVNGKPVEIVFQADKNSVATNKNVVISGIELNTPNVKDQAVKPFPFNADEHVDATNRTVLLSWEKAPNAVAHRVYFAESKNDLNDESSFKGEQTSNSWEAKFIDSSKSYFWRVDELAADGRVTPGNVWYFRARQLAFPGAEGYGRFARGGRGGVVVEVTNLNDDGPGSFREAVDAQIGPRTIVFAVSGNIELKSRLVINQPYITVAGQTAPGEGITITRAPLGLTGNDNIMRFMRVRIGAGKTYDGMGLTGANHSIIDHSSISWTIDESFSSRGAHNITLQRTLISEALNKANHHKYGEGKMHGFAATVGGDVGSFHHNLLAHCYGRNWSIGGGLNGDGFYTGRVDIRNNVVYNWGGRATDGGAREVNFVGNYYKPGAATSFFYALNMQHEGVGKGMQRAFFDGNVMTGYFNEKNQEEGRKASYSNGDTSSYVTFVEKPFFDPQMNTQSAAAAYKDVLSDVGCRLPLLDEHDQRIVRETIDSTFTYTGELSKMGGMIDTELDLGGFPNYKTIHREPNFDTDHDGLPNWWENVYGTNVNSEKGDFSDSNADSNHDGFTALEDYLNWLAEPHFFIHKKTKINLPDYFKGYIKTNGQYQLESSSSEKLVKLKDDKLIISTKVKGFVSAQVRVTDEQGDSKLRLFNFFVE